MIPSLYPIYDPHAQQMFGGSSVALCTFCKKSFSQSKSDCKNYYKRLESKCEGYFQCPYGFTSRVFYFRGEPWIITGLVVYPRFDTPHERDKAKRFPEVKTSREAVDRMVSMFKELDILRANVIQEGAKVFPQAFHELRKLNGAILQHAEKELKVQEDTAALITIMSAAELMRNNFDILEALSNIEGMRALPGDATINVFDLIYKMKRVLTEKARLRGMTISLTGVRAIIRGSQKSFPIVPAVLIENAIKYARERGTIRAEVSVAEKTAVITVENETDRVIDPIKCFEKGSRYAGNAVEGGGFGLFLAKEIVLAHKGSIRCENPHGKVRMIVELPLEKVVK